MRINLCDLIDGGALNTYLLLTLIKRRAEVMQVSIWAIGNADVSTVGGDWSDCYPMFLGEV
jgi:hypothetical protein